MKKIVQNLEIIVTDNASIDGTDIMIHSYLNDSQIIDIQRPENIGIARNIKEGFLALLFFGIGTRKKVLEKH